MRGIEKDYLCHHVMTRIVLFCWALRELSHFVGTGVPDGP